MQNRLGKRKGGRSIAVRKGLCAELSRGGGEQHRKADELEKCWRSQPGWCGN